MLDWAVEKLTKFEQLLSEEAGIDSEPWSRSAIREAMKGWKGMRKISKKDCQGCRDNFYNGNNDYGIEECWCFSSAEMVQKFELGTDIPMNIRSAYKKKTVPSCFRKRGVVYLKGIPDYAE